MQERIGDQANIKQFNDMHQNEKEKLRNKISK